MSLKTRLSKLEKSIAIEVAGRDDSEMCRIAYDHYPDCLFTPITSDIVAIELLKAGADPLQPNSEVAKTAWQNLTANREVKEYHQHGKTIYSI